MNKNTIPTPAQITEMYEIMNILSDKYNNKSTPDYCYSVTLDVSNDTTNIGEMFISLCVSKHFKVGDSDENKCELIENIKGSTFFVSVDEIISRMRETIKRVDEVS